MSAILTKLIFDRNLKGLGWKPGPAKWLGLAYLLPILYGAVIYGIVWLIGQGGFTTDVVAEVVGTGLGMADASSWADGRRLHALPGHHRISEERPARRVGRGAWLARLPVSRALAA